MKCVKVTQKCQGQKGFTDDTKQGDGTSGNNSQNVPLPTNCDQSDCDKMSDNQGIQYEHLGGHMLHSKGRHKRKSWKFHDFDSNPETRFMDMSSLCVMEWTERQEHERLHLVCCACSDATVRWASLVHSSFTFFESRFQISTLVLFAYLALMLNWYCSHTFYWLITGVVFDISCRQISQHFTTGNDKSTLIQVIMTWCHQATCHYLIQCLTKMY